MKLFDQKEMPPMMERYELKYTIAADMVAPICDFVSSFCVLDLYSSLSENYYYRVNNLYLDSPDYYFLRMKLEGGPNRFNMRIRTYGDNPSSPYYLEIKQKTGDVIRKYRSITTNPHFYKVYSEPGYADLEENPPFAEGRLIYEDEQKEMKNKQLFERLVYTYNASPKVLTQYSRMAWVSDIDDYARVTFDRELRFRPENEYNLKATEAEMVSYDSEVLFDPGCSVILELKCYTTHVPLWMIDMIKFFNLERRGFSKYGAGVFNALEFMRYDYAERVAII